MLRQMDRCGQCERTSVGCLKGWCDKVLSNSYQFGIGELVLCCVPKVMGWRSFVREFVPCMHPRYAGLVVIALALASTKAMGVNKCTASDGRVTYQEAACPTTAKDSKRISAQVNGAGNAGADLWKFKRSQDDMTSKVACLVMSPIPFPVSPMPKGFYPVHAVVLVGEDGKLVFGLRTSDNSISFHNELAGMGVKTDVGGFVALTIKSGSHMVAPADGDLLANELNKAGELRARVRFWPYEQLYDLKPLAMDGYLAALSEAKRCAKVPN